MLSAHIGGMNAYYGNIQLGFNVPQPYLWGAWKKRKHEYFEPLTPAEEKRIDEHHHPQVELPYDFITAQRLRDDAARRVEARQNRLVKQYKRPRFKTDDDEAFFMLM